MYYKILLLNNWLFVGDELLSVGCNVHHGGQNNKMDSRHNYRIPIPESLLHGKQGMVWKILLIIHKIKP